MKKQSEIGFLLVLTPVNQEINSKTFKLFNNPIIELEGFAIQLIGVKLASERIRKLNELLQKIGIEPLTDGDDRSEKLRLFIDNLYACMHVLDHYMFVKTSKMMRELLGIEIEKPKNFGDWVRQFAPHWEKRYLRIREVTAT